MAAQSSSTNPAEDFDLWPLPDETERHRQSILGIIERSAATWDKGLQRLLNVSNEWLQSMRQEDTDIKMSKMLEEILKRENNAAMVLEAEEPKIAERRSREIQKVLAFVTEVNKRKARFVELKTKAGETDLRGKAKQGL
ncbi:MAG: hypothetical protein Q9226_006543 [Calogaya cf. arnoldii]